MNKLKIATFGCWNQNLEITEKIVNLIKQEESYYDSLILLGDNYYHTKILFNNHKDNENDKNKIIKKIDLNQMKKGFNIIDKLNIPKKLIMGNHDIEEGYLQSCNVLNLQLKLPWYDVKFPFKFEIIELFNSESISKNKKSKIVIIYLDTNIYDMDSIGCYSMFYRDLDELKDDQTRFIKNVFTEYILKDESSVNTILFCGHQPLITVKNKIDNKTPSIIKEKSEVLIDLYNIITTEILKLSKIIDIIYLCADAHFYQFSEIIFNDKKITQLVFGTGGADLDLIPNKDNLKFTIENTLPLRFNIIDQNMSYGYGKLVINSNGTHSHTFIELPNIPIINSSLYELNNRSTNELYKPSILKPSLNFDPLISGQLVGGINSNYIKNKYLKYKNKYLELKNQKGNNNL